MAEMQIKNETKIMKGTKFSTRVNLTPMVDLGFLLITFFMFTTSLSQPKSMPYNTPYRDESTDAPALTKESLVLTCMLSKQDKVYAYRGIGSAANPPELQVLLLGQKGEGSVRNAFIDFMHDVHQKIQVGLLHPEDKAMVIIKPDTSCSFNNLVQILDEITINGIPTQATVPITSTDREYIRQTEIANGVK